MAEKRSEVPWVADEEKFLQEQVRAGKASLSMRNGARFPAEDPQDTGIKAPFWEVWQAEAGKGWAHKCVCLLEDG